MVLIQWMLCKQHTEAPFHVIHGIPHSSCSHPCKLGLSCYLLFRFPSPTSDIFSGVGLNPVHFILATLGLKLKFLILQERAENSLPTSWQITHRFCILILQFFPQVIVFGLEDKPNIRINPFCILHFSGCLKIGHWPCSLLSLCCILRKL